MRWILCAASRLWGRHRAVEDGFNLLVLHYPLRECVWQLGMGAGSRLIGVVVVVVTVRSIILSH